MARFRTRTYFTLSFVCILLVALGWLCLCGRNAPEGTAAPRPAAPSGHAIPTEEHSANFPTERTAVLEPALPDLDDTTAAALLEQVVEQAVQPPSLYAIRGTVFQQAGSDTWMEEWMARLEAAGSPEEMERMFHEYQPPGFERLPAPQALVTLQSDSVRVSAVSDAEGTFEIVAPRGDYEFFSAIPARPLSTGLERVMRGSRGVRLRGDVSMDLELRWDLALASVTGRITDVYGNPIAGAKVTAIEDVEDAVSGYKPREYSAVSDPDGFYQLQRIEPTDFYRTAGYLVTGRPGTRRCVNIRVEADGFAQGDEDVPKVPVVTEEGLYWARRFLKAVARHVEEIQEMEDGSEISLQEKEDLSLPSIEGSTITGIDVVLERAE